MSILSILLMNIHFIYVCLSASWFHCFWNSKEYVDKTEAIRQEHKRTSIWSKQRISLWRIQALFGCQWTLWYNSVIKWRNKILLDKTRYILSGLSFNFLIPDTRFKTTKFIELSFIYLGVYYSKILWKSHKHGLRHIRIWSLLVFLLESEIDKMDSCSEACMF